MAGFWGGEVSRSSQTAPVKKYFDFSSRLFVCQQHMQQLSRMPPTSGSQQQKGIRYNDVVGNFSHFVLTRAVTVEKFNSFIRRSPSPQQAVRWWQAGCRAVHLQRGRSSTRVKVKKSEKASHRISASLQEDFSSGFREPTRNQEQSKYMNWKLDSVWKTIQALLMVLCCCIIV